MERWIFICEDSIEGIFAGVYDAWASRCGHDRVELVVKEPEEMEFFCRYIPVLADSEKAGKVMRTLYNRLGSGVYGCLCYAAFADCEEKGTAIYHTIVDFLSVHGSMRGKKIPSGREISG